MDIELHYVHWIVLRTSLEEEDKHGNHSPYSLLSCLCRHSAINLFLQTYRSQWLQAVEPHAHRSLTEELLDHQDFLSQAAPSHLPPNYRDPLTQLFTMVKRRANRGERCVFVGDQCWTQTESFGSNVYSLSVVLIMTCTWLIPTCWPRYDVLLLLLNGAWCMC